MSNKTKNKVVKERNSDGVPARYAHPIRSSSNLTVPKVNTNADRKAEEFSEGDKRIAKGGVSSNKPRKNGAKSTCSTAVRTVRALLEETSCVSIKGSSVPKHTASSLAKKEARGGLETAKVTQTVRIGKRMDAPVPETEVRTLTPQKGSRAKVHVDDKEGVSAGKLKSKPPVSSVKREQTIPPCGTSKQPAITINPSPPVKPNKPTDVSGKKLLPKDQTSEERRIRGKQPEYEASTSKSSLDSDSNTYSDGEHHHIVWNGYAQPDKIEERCFLCEKHVEDEPTAGRKNLFSNLPVVAILPCGHAFHVDCLYCDQVELQPGGEPPCIICASNMTY